jgi:hypothetical protein
LERGRAERRLRRLVEPKVDRRLHGEQPADEQRTEQQQ